MIKSISLKNWKSHLDTRMEFSKGVNAIVGIMGSGKSSIMQGISFALYGNFPLMQSKKVSISDLIMRKPQRKDIAEVELEFVLGEDTYYIKRVISRDKGTTHAEIRKNGALLDVNPAGVTREVERILGMDYDIFSKAVYAEQDAMDYFLRIPKGKRMEHIDRMLKVDRFKTARDNGVTLSNTIKNKRDGLAAILEDIKREDLERKLENGKAELTRMKALGEELIKELSDVSKSKMDLYAEIKRFEEYDRKERSSRLEMERLKASSRQMEESIREKINSLGIDVVFERGNYLQIIKEQKSNIEYTIEKMDSHLREVAERLVDKERLERERSSFMNAISNRIEHIEKRELPLLEKKLAEAGEIKKSISELMESLHGRDVETLLKESRESLHKVRDSLHSLKIRKDQGREAIENLNKFEGKCEVCDSELGSEKKRDLIARKASMIVDMENEIKGLSVKESVLMEDVERYENIRKDLLVLGEKMKYYGEDYGDLISKARGEMEEFRNSTRNLEQEVGKIREDVKTLREIISEEKLKREMVKTKLDALHSIKILMDGMYDNEDKVSGISKILEEIGKSLEGADIESLRERYGKAISRESEISSGMKAMELRGRELGERIEDFEKRLEIKGRYVSDVERFSRNVDELKAFIGVLEATQDQLREEFLKNVNNIIDGVWTEIYPYNDFDGVRLGIDSNDYVLELKHGDEWISVDGIVSGGERSLATLALRIAFSLSFVPNLRWLILDEPTHNLDVNAISKFSEIMKNRIGLFSEQVFLITHEERIAEGLSSVYSLERNKDINEPTRVS